MIPLIDSISTVTVLTDILAGNVALMVNCREEETYFSQYLRENLSHARTLRCSLFVQRHFED